MKTSHTYITQRGNAMFIIFLALLLLAALSAAVVKSTRNPGFQQKETVTFLATEIVKYGTDLQLGTDFLLNNGIDPLGIDFVAPGAAGFDTAPHTAKMFHPAGAGIVYQEQKQDGYAAFAYNQLADIEDHGENTPADARMADVTFGAEVSQEVCQEINKNIHGVTTVPSIPTGILATFLTGAFTTVYCDAVNGLDCKNFTNICITDLSGGIVWNDQTPIYHAGWSLPQPSKLETTPPVENAYATAGSEIYVYLHVLVTQ